MIKLIALDLDGTLFNKDHEITPRTEKAIKTAINQGVIVIPATGRPLSGVPERVKAIEGIPYVLTANGAAVYKMGTNECIYEDAMDTELTCKILARLAQYEVMSNVYIKGQAYMGEVDCRYLDQMEMSERSREYIRNSRKVVDDVAELITREQLRVQKITVNFRANEDGSLRHMKEVYDMQNEFPMLTFVSGGVANVEITNASANKGNCLRKLGELFGITMDEIMACGDSGNDLTMIQAVGLSVAMENAEEAIKKAAKVVTLSNENDGVGVAIERYALRNQA